MKKFIFSKLATLLIIFMFTISLVYLVWFVYYVAKIFINH